MNGASDLNGLRKTFHPGAPGFVHSAVNYPGDPPPETYKEYHPPGDLLQGMLGYHFPPLWTEFLTHVTENITLPQTSFAGGNNLGHQGKIRLSSFIFSKKIQNRQTHFVNGTWDQTRIVTVLNHAEPFVHVNWLYVHTSLHFLDLVHLKSIEHDYIKILKSQTYKYMPD